MGRAHAGARDAIHAGTGGGDGDARYSPLDQGAAVSSGSFVTGGIGRSRLHMRTLAAIAGGNGDHLVHRAADVILKERRKLVLVVRNCR